MSQVLSGCAVRAVIQQEQSKLTEEERHYLNCIKTRLVSLYDGTTAPNIREQMQDEIGWLEERLGVAE